MLVDTGAAISILASYMVSEKIKKIDYSVNLFGIVGKEISIKTEGIVVGQFKMGEQLINTTLHLVNPKYSGPGMGYFGFDILSALCMIVDMNEMCVALSLGNLIANKDNEINRAKNNDEMDTISLDKAIGSSNGSCSAFCSHKATEFTDTRKTSDEKFENRRISLGGPYENIYAEISDGNLHENIYDETVDTFENNGNFFKILYNNYDFSEKNVK